MAARGDTLPVAGGFASESGVRGSFSHEFTEVGDYFFIAGGYGHIGKIYSLAFFTLVFQSSVVIYQDFVLSLHLAQCICFVF